jgi:hypothetical protein
MSTHEPRPPGAGPVHVAPKGERSTRRRNRRRAASLAFAVTSVLAGELTLNQAPAEAGTVGVSGRIQGAGSISSVEGGPYSCSATWNQDDRNLVTCPRVPFGAVFEAWVWLEATPASTPLGNWRFDHWEGCNTTRVVNGNVQCAVHSGAFTLDETFPKAVFDDFVPPTVTGLTPAQSPFVDRQFSFTFGANDPATFACALDSEPMQSCSSGYTRTMSEGEHTVSVRATDPSGNNSPTRTSNVVALDTSLTSGPGGLTSSRDATFGYSTTGGNSFECALDFAPFTACGTGSQASRTYSGLGDGTHTLRVRAVNGQWFDQLPASRSWSIDSTPPDTVLTDATTSGRSATFGFDGTGGQTGFECRLDGPSAAHGWQPCGSPAGYGNLADGAYQFQVRSRDAAGNVDPTPASRSWTVDQTAPETTITSGPAEDGWSLLPTATLGFSSSKAGSTFECSFDGAARACTGATFTENGITPGTHSFTVAARDSQGNLDATSARRIWTVPLDDVGLHHGAGWQLRSSGSAYLGTYSAATRQGATLSKQVVGARKIALVASKGPGFGSVKVFSGSTLLKTVPLAAPSLRTKRVIPIASFASPVSSTIRIVVATTGKPVRIEGLGVAT